MGNEGVEGAREDPRVSNVLERLSQLEGRVGGQLDQLVHLQQQQVVIQPLLNPCLFVCVLVLYAVTLGCALAEATMSSRS